MKRKISSSRGKIKPAFDFLSKSELCALEHNLKATIRPCTTSTKVFAYGYSEEGEHKGLIIVFKNNLIYIYPHKTVKDFLSLEEAVSKGKWVNDNLVITNEPFAKFKLIRLHGHR